MNPVFLTLDEVLALHRDQIERYGGAMGLRDLGLLQSALGTPQASFGGGFLHCSLPEMAAAYLYHIVCNHPFVDGNKRTGLMAAIGFLGLNGLELNANPDVLARLVLGIAAGSVSKAEAAVFLAAHSL